MHYYVHLSYSLEDSQVLENVIIDHLRVLETSLISILIGLISLNDNDNSFKSGDAYDKLFHHAV